MSSVLQDLVSAIEAQHGGRAVFRSIERVDERHDGKAVWQGEVHVFDLEDHPSATTAYAWSSPVDGWSGRRRFYAVLHLGGIRSARDAVRAAIVAEARK